MRPITARRRRKAGLQMGPEVENEGVKAQKEALGDVKPF